MRPFLPIIYVMALALRLSAEEGSTVKTTVQSSSSSALVIETHVTASRDGVRYLEGSVRNNSEQEVTLDKITLDLPWIKTGDADLLVSAGASTMVRPTEVFAPARSQQNHSSATYLQAKHDQRFSLIAFTTWNTFWSELSYVDGNVRVTADGEGRALKPGEKLALETLRFSESDDWQKQLTDYADDLARTLKIKLKPRRTFVGWSTWDYYGRTWTAQNVTDNLAALKTIEPKANILQIDGGWWPSRGDYLVVRDNLKTAGGMKGLAQQIKAAGLEAGIHFDGGRGDSRSTVYKQHPDYFLHDDRGELIGQTIRSAKEELRNIYFDYSNPAAIDYLRNVTRTMRRDWGYNYIKIDFLWFNLDWAIRHDAKMDPARHIAPFNRHTTSVERLHLGMRAFREGMGDDAWFLGCGAPFGLVYGYIDSLRTSFDIWPNTTQFKENVAANGAMFYLHERVVYDDADYQISRSKEDQDKTLVPDKSKDAGDLTRNEAEMWANYSGLFSITKINSDNLPILRPERRELFTQAAALPNCSRFVPIDFWAHERTLDDAYNVMLGEAKDGVYLAVFNWSDHEETYALDGIGSNVPTKILGEVTTDQSKKTFNVKLPGMHSAVFRFPAGAKFETLRRAITLKK